MQMKIIERGVLNAAQPGTRRAMATFPSVATLPDRSLLATYRVGTTKDSGDETVELRRSFDNGRTWTEPASPFSTTLNGRSGALRCAYVTPLSGNHLLACALWIDRETYPGKPLFNAETEGCLPMAVLLAGSHDLGASWTPWRVVPVTDDIGPPSLTSPVLRFHSGKLAISIETNKNYYDRSPWDQRVVYVFSEDDGKTWSAPQTICRDPETRICSWDQRAAVAPDGRVLTFSWTYDKKTNCYVNIQRRISSDEGKTWSGPVDLGITDQPSRPAILPGGRVALAWVDRYQTHSIRARLADNPDAEFRPETEVVLYSLEQQRPSDFRNTGELLADMSVWTYGLPYAEALPNGEVMVVYYAGSESCIDIHWSRLSPD
jgi:hypothetical protein